MSNYFITSEATADFPESLFKEDFRIIPMSYSVCGKDYDGDKNKLSPKEFYDICRQAKCKEDLPTTAMVTAYVAKEFFKPILMQGYDIVHIGFSQALSGTYDQLCMAVEELKQEFPQRKITVINSKSASFVEGLIIHYALDAREKGATYEQCVELIEKLSNQACGFFTIDDIKHLYRTGRVSKTEALIGGALQIKPVLCIDGEGKLVPVAKAISKKKAMRTIIDLASKNMLPAESQKLVAIGHADAFDDAVSLEKIVRETLNIDNTIIFDVGSVVGSHVGAGMLAVVLLCENRQLK